jgi:hypothetical protein
MASAPPPPPGELASIVSPLLVAEDGSSALSSQASLFLARDLTGKEVVLKRTTARTKEQLTSAQSEVSLLRKIRHPNVVAFCGVWTRPLHPGTEGQFSVYVISEFLRFIISVSVALFNHIHLIIFSCV